MDSKAELARLDELADKLRSANDASALFNPSDCQVVSDVLKKDDLSGSDLTTIINYVTPLALCKKLSSNEVLSKLLEDLYAFCNRSSSKESVKERAKSICSLSLAVVETPRGSVESLLQGIILFHSHVIIPEAQQLLEYAAVNCSRSFLSVAKKALDANVTTASCRLLSPLGLLVVSSKYASSEFDFFLRVAVSSLPKTVCPEQRRHCLGFIGSCFLQFGSEFVLSSFQSCHVNLLIFFTLVCVEVRMILEHHSNDMERYGDFLGCCLNSLDIALEDVCSGAVELSPDDVIAFHDAFKATSNSIIEYLLSPPPKEKIDWMLVRSMWRLLGTWLCETSVSTNSQIDFKLLLDRTGEILKLHKSPASDLVNCLLPMLFQMCSTPDLLDKMHDNGIHTHVIHFLKLNVFAADSETKSSVQVILACQVLVFLSQKHLLPELDAWDVDVLKITNDDVFIHVTRLLLKSYSDQSIKTADQLMAVIERLNKLSLDSDGFHDECIEALSMLKVQ